MATDLDVDDQWLYGSSEDLSSPVKPKGGIEKSNVIKENGNGTVSGRPHTPTLDDMETALDAPSLPLVSKIVSTAPDLQPKQPSVMEDDLLDDEDKDAERGDVDEPEAGELEEGGDSESDDEDDVQITIGEITNIPGGYTRTPSYTRMAIGSGAGVALPGSGKKVDVDAIPQIGGQSLLEFDLEASVDKPWRLPGSDITDYFNYGFTEETWKLYSDKQRKLKGDVNQLNKIAVRSVRPGEARLPPHIPGFPPPMLNMQLPPFLPPAGLMTQDVNVNPFEPTGNADGSDNNGDRNADNASDGRATPGVDVHPSLHTTKLPLLPPPTIMPPSLPSIPPRPIPPPFVLPPPGFSGMPPGQENIAAAMAAMFGGGIRPPEPMPNMPPPPPHLLPPFQPPGFHGRDPGIVPPFPGMPPHFPMAGGDHGPIIDDRGMPIPHDMLMSGRLLGQGFPWDPSMGPPPPELLEAFVHHDEHRGSRSVSRSSSYSQSRSRSRSSSYEDRSRLSSRKRDRRHRRHSRSRSHDRDRDRDRDRHRSSRHHRNGDHHRSDRHERERERERDRDKDRDRDREGRKRREHREEKSRHERSSRRHRSSSRSREDERISRKEKSKADQDSRESRSKSRTP